MSSLYLNPLENWFSSSKRIIISLVDFLCDFLGIITNFENVWEISQISQVFPDI